MELAGLEPATSWVRSKPSSHGVRLDSTSWIGARLGSTSWFMAAADPLR
jgi:hypothetical protein